MKKLIVGLFFFAVAACSGFSAAKIEIVSTPYKAGDFGVHTFRIPALCTAKDGAILAFCEARMKASGDDGHINLVVRRSADGGATWSDMAVIASDSVGTFGNPVPVLDEKSGKIILVMAHTPAGYTESTMGNYPDAHTRRIFVCESCDGGLFWTKPRDLTKELNLGKGAWYAVGPGGGMQIKGGEHSGRIVVPVNTAKKDMWRAGAIYSDDFGKTWRLGKWCDFHSANESQIAQIGDCLFLNMRVQNSLKNMNIPRYRRVAAGFDFGESWRASAYDFELLEPVCQGTFISFEKDGKEYVAFSNPEHGKKRVNLTLKVADGSEYIDWFKRGCPQIAEKPRWKREFSAGEKNPSAYSDMCVLPDGKIGLIYETGEKKYFEKIVFLRLNLN